MPDDWEVKREDVTVMEELGKGSFGMVYRGLYQHPDPEKVIHLSPQTFIGIYLIWAEGDNLEFSALCC